MSLYKNLPNISLAKLEKKLCHVFNWMLKTQKTEDFNRRLNNHGKDVNRKDRIPASNHLGQASLQKFIITEQLNQSIFQKSMLWK